MCSPELIKTCNNIGIEYSALDVLLISKHPEKHDSTLTLWGIECRPMAKKI
jgi:hypothetical protein